MPDEQDQAEQLDGDKLGGEFPPEELLGAHRHQDDAIPESFAAREAHTEPEVGAAGADPTVPLLDEEISTSEEDLAAVPAPAEEAALHVDEPG